MIKNIIKVTLFLLMVGILQWLVGSHAPGMSFYNLELLNKYLAQPVDILIFGDSTDWYSADGDKDKRSISRMLGDMLPGKRVKSISHAAYQLDIYGAFCEYIVRQKNRPRCIIIPLNLRSFSPEWDREPHYQFEKEKIILEGGLPRSFYKPLQVIKYRFNPISQAEYWETPVFKRDLEIGKIKDMKGLKNQFLLKYMYSLTGEHRKIKSLVRIARLLSSHGIAVLFYITPVDYQAGERFFPGEFKEQVSRNSTFITELLAGEGMSLQLLNLSLELGSDYFAWKIPSPNEHLNQEGRRFAAEQLLKKIFTFVKT